MAPAPASGPGDDGLRKLEYLSLVSKVCSELETHIGVGDKVLAEFITELGRDSTTVAEFDARLKEKGADFPDYFVRTLLTILPDYFVRTLLTIIHAILPPPQAGSGAKNPSAAGDGASQFPGLSRPDDPDHARNLRLELERDAAAAAPDPASARDDRDRRRDGRGRDHRDHDRDRDRDRDRGGRDRDGDRDREYGRDRDRDRGREHGRDRDRDRDRGRDHRDRDRDRGRDREMERDDRDRDRRRSRRYEDEEEEEDRDRRGRQVAAVNTSGEPELYQVYRGRVTRVMDTGCFVRLEGVPGGREGLVHVSQMASKRVANAKEVVKRDQEVFVLFLFVGATIAASVRVLGI